MVMAIVQHSAACALIRLVSRTSTAVILKVFLIHLLLSILDTSLLPPKPDKANTR